jgi:hypothetical protein
LVVYLSVSTHRACPCTGSSTNIRAHTFTPSLIHTRTLSRIRTRTRTRTGICSRIRTRICSYRELHHHLHLVREHEPAGTRWLRA